MKDFKNWTEATKNLYRYVFGSNACYEIHILFWSHGTDILTAKASLYVCGEWHSEKDGKSFFERECLLSEQPVFECIAMATKDFEENCE